MQKMQQWSDTGYGCPPGIIGKPGFIVPIPGTGLQKNRGMSNDMFLPCQVHGGGGRELLFPAPPVSDQGRMTEKSQVFFQTIRLPLLTFPGALT
jgi:hypothetical protein